MRADIIGHLKPCMTEYLPTYLLRLRPMISTRTRTSVIHGTVCAPTAFVVVGRGGMAWRGVHRKLTVVARFAVLSQQQLPVNFHTWSTYTQLYYTCIATDNEHGTE